MPRFNFRTEPNDIASASGSVWVMCGKTELTHDCGSERELEAAIDDLIAQLQALRSEAPRIFALNRKSRNA
jgi:hypothetical protein